jgi:hypothetical protein
MEILITHPSLDEYHRRLVAMANKYGCESWIGLMQDLVSREDWFEYSFIVSTVGDQLIQREFVDIFQTPSHLGTTYGTSTEPGLVPGSVFLAGVKSECAAVCGTY